MARYRAQRGGCAPGARNGHAAALPAPAAGQPGAPASFASRAGEYFQLTKPRVVALIVFTAIVGMFLAVPGLPPAGGLFWGTLGIAGAVLFLA